MITTEGQLYLVALTTLEKLVFQFVPEGITSTRSSNFAPIAVVGRNIPQYHFTGGQESMQIELDFFASTENREDVITKVQWLKSLTHSNNYENPPQKVAVIWGDLFKDEVWILNNVSTQLSLFSKKHGYLPQQAYVKLNFLLDLQDNPSWSDTQR